MFELSIRQQLVLVKHLLAVNLDCISFTVALIDAKEYLAHSTLSDEIGQLIVPYENRLGLRVHFSPFGNGLIPLQGAPKLLP